METPDRETFDRSRRASYTGLLMALSIGTKAPDFTLPTKTAEGPKQITLSENFGKRNTVLLFFPWPSPAPARRKCAT